MRSNGECSPERPRNSQKLAAMTLLLAAVGRGSEIPPLLEWLTREAHHERAQYSPRRPVWVLIRAASPVVPGAASDRDRRLWFAGLFAARLSAGHHQREAPEILWTPLDEGIGIALDLAGDRMWVTDL